MRNLVDLAIEAHGGLKLWPEIKEVELRLSLTGVLFQIKGYPAGLPNITMKIAAHEQRMSISPYPQTGQIGHFMPQRVWIEDAAGKISGQLENPLSSFAGHRGTNYRRCISSAMRSGTTSQRHSCFWSPASKHASSNHTKKMVRYGGACM